MSDLSVVDNVEQHRGDDAADGVGQHEDHHPLPTPQRNFSFTGGEVEKTVKVSKDLTSTWSIGALQRDA